MKFTIVFLSLFSLISCASIENKANTSNYSSHETLNDPQNGPTSSKDTGGAKDAMLGVALATTIGVLTKDHFKCTEECEKGLKESIEKRTKNK